MGTKLLDTLTVFLKVFFEKKILKNCKELKGYDRTLVRVRNRKIIFLFLNQNICCGY